MAANVKMTAAGATLLANGIQSATPSGAGSARHVAAI
jgi:hypothetical protein